MDSAICRRHCDFCKKYVKVLPYDRNFITSVTRGKHSSHVPKETNHLHLPWRFEHVTTMTQNRQPPHAARPSYTAITRHSLSGSRFSETYTISPKGGQRALPLFHFWTKSDDVSNTHILHLRYSFGSSARLARFFRDVGLKRNLKIRVTAYPANFIACPPLR